MTFTINDFHDLVELLEREPGWRSELRRLVLTSELLDLPQQVRLLIEAQSRTEARVAELAEALAELAESSNRFQRQMELRFEAVEQQIATLVQVQQDMAVDVGTLKGWMAEQRFERFAASRFGAIIRRAHVLTHDELWRLLDDGIARGVITDSEADSIELADLVIRGRARPDQREVLLVVEVSWGIGYHDVERAADRAALLAKVGVETIPVVAGQWAAADVRRAAEGFGVWHVTDGGVGSPPAESSSENVTN